MNAFILTVFFVIGSLVSLAGGAWIAGAAVVHASQAAANNLCEDLQSTNYSLLSNLH